MRLIVMALCACLLLCFPAHASQNATSAWNSVCATYHFAPAGGLFTGTFAQGYSGSDFVSDFKDAKAATAQLMATTLPPFDGGDPLSASVANWPDS